MQIAKDKEDASKKGEEQKESKSGPAKVEEAFSLLAGFDQLRPDFNLRPLCDSPQLHTGWSVNLNDALGPWCGRAPANSCCFVPLGYSRGHPMGTPCSKVCAGAAGKGRSAKGRKACRAAAASDKVHSFYGLLWSKLIAEDDEELAWVDNVEPLTALHTR